ncbi:hypothetical protein [Chondrinema litorale]|uniref:hypothetical protein n=1 Tax=Chondrinema litorale TaxID=2994555 RepID=UPI002543F683|nr:hypothetical protein [Chondrinema litorale]UZR95941.1 hypothetical protein OQ292_08960 [Chondrinema litorale]
MNVIQFYIDNFNYQDALKIYNQLTADCLTKDLLNKGESHFNKIKLLSELEKLKEKQVYLDLSSLNQSSFEQKHPNNAFLEDVKELDEKWKQLYKEASFLQQKLLNYSETERMAAAFIILDYFDEIHDIWDDLKTFENTGALPRRDKKSFEMTDLQSLLRRRNTLRTYLSKAKKGRLSKENIAEWEEEIRQIEKLIS